MTALTLAKPPAPSPFKNGNQYAWDATSLSALKKCPRYYQYTILQGLRRKDESVHLTFGGIYAKAVEIYEKARAAGFDFNDGVDAAIDYALRDSWGKLEREKHNLKNRDTLIRSLVWYFDTYRPYENQIKTLIQHNGQPAVELSFQFESDIPFEGNQNYILCGHLDRVVDFGGTIYVMDQKTTGMTLSGYYFNQYDPDNQMSLYTLASKVAFGFPVQGVIIDAAQIAVGFTAFSRGITMRSDGQLDEWLEGAAQWFATARSYTAAGIWPMNEASCNNYGGCTFKDICNKDPRVRKNFIETNFEVRHWNPLEVR